MKTFLFNGDSLAIMKQNKANSIDAIVTDPPYGLSFMGKKWDYDVPSVEIWKECERVLKPGGYLLAFAGTRTYHRMAVRIEDAGFEIRDMLAWVYGSGFPKSLDIGKAVDKLLGNEREIVGKRHNTYDGSIRNPDKHRSPAELSNIGKWGLNQTPHGLDLTKGNSDWEGWGTALKPAFEPIVVARKYLSEDTVAKNVLKWGVGGINIDGCRVETEDNLNGGAYSGGERSDGDWKEHSGFKNNKLEEYVQPQGRFPANFIHDGSEEVIELFPESNGGAFPMKSNVPTGQHYDGGWGNVDNETRIEMGKGSAARFFYCAKVSKKERNLGCELLEEKITDADYRPNDDGDKGVQSRLHGATVKGKNNHPTVKPIALMRYLCKLVTPPNGIILDPFMGSGSTGIGAILEGFKFAGIEIDSDYVEIAKSRIAYWKDQIKKDKLREE